MRPRIEQTCDRCRKRAGSVKNGYRFTDGRKAQVWLCDSCAALLAGSGYFWCNACRWATRLDDRYREKDRYCKGCTRLQSQHYYDRHADRRCAQAQRYYDRNRDLILERVRRQTAAHPEVRRAYKARRRAAINAQARAYYARPCEVCGVRLSQHWRCKGCTCLGHALGRRGDLCILCARDRRLGVSPVKDYEA